MSKFSRKNRKRMTKVVAMTILLALLYLALTGRIKVLTNILDNSSDPWEVARSRVRIGDNRKDALIALSDAWFHSECESETKIRDLFFYGSHDPEQVQVVIVNSQKEDGNRTVIFVGSVENYMLHLYNDCIPIPLEAFNEP